MGMFDNYNNLNPDYIPDNTSSNTDVKYICNNNTLPRKIFSVKNTFLGYQWHQGELFTYKVSANKTIKVDSDAIVYTENGQAPDLTTMGTRIGQHAYNTKDSKSWTFSGKTENTYIWIEDECVVYPLKGDKSITLCTNMKNQYVQFNIFNFRWESVYEKTGDVGEAELSIDIDKSLSDILVPGVYYVLVHICSDTDKRLSEKYMFVVS